MAVDYTFSFNPITENFSSVNFIDHNKNKSNSIRVAIKDRQLLTQTYVQISAIVADLIDIALATYIVDRMIVRTNNMPCRIEIHLPLRCLEVFNQKPILEKLQEVLAWYTNDEWLFCFSVRHQYGRITETQTSLITKQPIYNDNVILWSGGLDALAGLYTQLKASPGQHFTLCASGSNSFMNKVQRNLLTKINAQFPERARIIQIPIRLIDTQKQQKNSSQRTRGFVFILLGIACAYHLGLSKLTIYENGIGAINLPFTEAEIEMDHSRAVHPLSLLHMSDFASKIFKKDFKIENPFLFKTKAQICKVFKDNNDTTIIFESVSCDSRHRNKTFQCGYCSSCLLRRIALAAQGIPDQTKYVILEANHIDKLSQEEILHWKAMEAQIEDLRNILNKPNAWEHLSHKYLWLQPIVDRTYRKEEKEKSNMIRQILQLYSQHIQEWDKAKPIIEPRLV